MKTLCLLLSFLIILLAGCATNNGVIVSARHDAHFSPTPADKIVMALRPNPSAEDAALGSALLAELARENFNIVTNADADYTLTYMVEDDSTERTYYHQEQILGRNPFVVTPPPQSTREIETPLMLNNSSQYESQETIMVPTTLVYRSKGIRLYLYANPKTHPGGLQIAWSGCIEAGKSIPADREPILIKTLLVHFGQDYAGNVSLPK
jgi:hypothetical protein